MKHLRLLFAIAFSIAFLSGCATVTMLNTAYPAQSLDFNIEVFVTNRPNCEYVEIAIIKGDDFFSEADALNQIKVKAREVGADAVIITGSAGTSSYGTPIGNMTYYSTEESGIKAVAIKYKN